MADIEQNTRQELETEEAARSSLKQQLSSLQKDNLEDLAAELENNRNKVMQAREDVRATADANMQSEVC